MTKKITETVAAVESAKKSLAEVETAVSSLTEELSKLEQEHGQIEEQIESGSLVADIDRKAELEELIRRRRIHLEDLEGRVLPDAEHALAYAEAMEVGDSSSIGVPEKHAEYVAAAESARAKISAGIEELKTATAEWEEFSRPLVQRVEKAGLVHGKNDSTTRVLVAGHGRNAHLVIDGTEYAAPEFNRDLAGTLGAADEYLAGTLARGLEARRWNVSVAEIGH